MKILRHNHIGNRFGYRIELGEYDATPPVLDLILDTAPQKKDPNREALALYLLLNRWCGGQFSLPNFVSPHTAETLGHDFAPTRLDFATVEYYPKPIPLGNNRVLLTDSIQNVGQSRALISLREDHWSGGMRSIDALVASNNFFLLSKHPNDIEPLLAFGVLFAEDLDVDTLVIDSALPSAELKRFQNLLRCVRLDVETVND